MEIPEEQRLIYNDIIRKLTFKPCIDQHLFVDTIIEQNLGIKEYDALIQHRDVDKYGSFKLEYSNLLSVASKKCTRLLEHLVCPPAQNTPLSQLIPLPKWFDYSMEKHQICLYNEMNLYLNQTSKYGVKFIEIEKILSKEYIINTLSDEEIANNKELIEKHYPYISLSKRDGFNYIEFIIMINICYAKRSRSLTVLDKIISHQVKKQDAEIWVNDVICHMRSPKMRRIYIDMLFHVFYNELVDPYNTLLIEYGKTIWLSEKYKKRKDILNAIEKHGERQNDIHFDKPFDKFILEQKETSAIELETMFSIIIPTVWNKLISSSQDHNQSQDIFVCDSSHVKECLQITKLNINDTRQDIYAYNPYDLIECERIINLYIDKCLDAVEKILQESLIQSYP